MTEEKVTPSDLFLRLDERIETNRIDSEKKNQKIADDVSDLLRQDLETSHKVDLIIQRQDQLRERFEHTSKTGFKTFEMVQSLHKDFGDLINRMTLNEKDTRIAQEAADDANRKYDKVITGIFVTVFITLVGLVLNYLVGKRIEIESKREIVAAPLRN